VHFGIEVFRWLISVKLMLKSINEIFGIGWLPHQASHAFDDVITPVIDRALVIVIPSHTLESV